MTRLSQVPASASPTHLMLIGDTKVGKSTFIAQAAVDGHTVIYVDSDNGISAIRNLIPEGHEARDRILYYRTDSPWKFIHDMLTLGVFRWNLTKDAPYVSSSGSPTDEVVEIYPARLPKTLILAIDSWTSVAFDAMEVGAKERNKTLLTMKDDSQGVYGEASLRLNLLCAILQHAPFHVICLAHPTLYEMYTKPKGRAGDIKQKDMILTGSVQIPVSSTRPHGHTMGKYFTDIGWLEINTMGKRIIDFTAHPGRISGGTVTKEGPVNELTFSKLFASPVETEISDSWIKYYTHEEFLAARAAKNPPAPSPAGVKASGEIAKTPANPTVTALMSKAK